MKKVRTEIETTPIGQEIEIEWFSGTPEEAESLLRNGNCDGLEVRVGGKTYDVWIQHGTTSLVVEEIQAATGADKDEQGDPSQIVSLGEYLRGRTVEFAPRCILTI
ncbi:MAG: hypothetical protein IJ783_00570 [Kiritimatiellae bacterium]|nr:hypothetical protein [Kiritimatiellia bacterium]